MLCGFICKPIGEKVCGLDLCCSLSQEELYLNVPIAQLFGEDGLSAFWFGLFVAVLSCTIGQQVELTILCANAFACSYDVLW